MGGQRDDWFRQQFRDGGAGAQAALEDEEEAESEEEPAPMLAIADIAELGLVAPVVQFKGLSRCIVLLPGGDESTIYFDRSSHESGKQRGWVDCQKHRCIKYVFCTGSKASFCTYMHL